MALSEEQEILLLPHAEVETCGFRAVERNEFGSWRWALGAEQSVQFPAQGRHHRVHYRIMIPLAGCRVTLLHEGRSLASHRAGEDNATFSGFADFSGEPGRQVLRFAFEREPGVSPHPVDPRLSFTVQQCLLVETSGPEAAKASRELLSSMRVALISMPSWTTFVPPMGVAYLASVLREAGVEASVHDYNITAWHVLRERRIGGENLWSFRNAKYWREAALFEQTLLPELRPSLDALVDQLCASAPDVIGFTLFYTSIPCMNAIARACRARLPAVKIVCGGPEMSAANLEYLLEQMKTSPIDVAAIGEGEGTLIELVSRWANGATLDGCRGIVHRRRSGAPVVEPLRAQLPFASVPFPDYSGFDLSLYEEPHALPIMMSRGCVARCAFCSESRFWQKFRYDDAERTFTQMRELVSRYGVNKFYFNDSLINGNFDALSKLADLLIASRLRVRWMGQARVDKRMTPELLQRLALSGCDFISYGFESGSQKVIDRMEKRTTVETARRVIRDTYEAGIRTSLNVIVGFPGEEEEDFLSTMEFVSENLPYIWQVGINEMNIFVGIPVGDDPHRFGVATETYHLGPLWETKDGRNTPAVRQERLRRIRALVDDFGIRQGLGSSSM